MRHLYTVRFCLSSKNDVSMIIFLPCFSAPKMQLYIYINVIDTSLGACRTLHNLSFVKRKPHSIGVGI